MKTPFTNLIGYIKTDRWILLSICIIAALRFSFIGLMGLMPQDAYYYFYGQHLALSYFDHPPAIALIMRGFGEVFGRHAWVIKLADTVITSLTIFAFYHLAKKFLSRHKAWNALLAIYSTLMVTILSLVTTPDVPLMLCWTVSLLCLYNVIFEKRSFWWIWAGLAMGAAFDSKYTAIFLPAGTILFLLLSRPHRKWLISPWFYLSVIIFIVAISPVIIWNVNNDFASFRFQSSERAHDIALNWLDVLGVIGHQSAILLPALFFGLLYYLWKLLRKYGLKWWKLSDRTLWLLCFFLPVFLGFLVISPIYWVKLNWMMPGYITAIIWIGPWLTRKFLRVQWIISLIVHLALAVEILCYPVPVKSDDTWMGWADFGKQVAVIQSNYPDDFIFSADDYKTSAMLNFYLGRMVYSQEILGRRALEFDFIGTDLEKLRGRNAIFINSLTDVTDDVDELKFTEDLKPYFSSITQLPPVIVTRNGRVVRKFLVFRCSNYQPPHTY
ncbi:glycosyltransferase family 39 protein [Chitinophaga sp. Cy-1792]|uniref:ArnT family glycosyltransferase n=1 Tax=Chitinophaga sp. Cy-1792 TaxID=2608339 RepID=UPI001421860D|nr:glycosyltransferase family 39 protein [Chitinophaga sp. Cy-1792]NIG57442.1 hypothetical protein [Chitinophaga sp. Cy-1792]